MAGFWMPNKSSLVVLCEVAQGDVKLRPRISQEVRGSPELQNADLRALEEALDDFLLEAFSCQVWSFSVQQGRLQVVPGAIEEKPDPFQASSL